MTIETLNGAMWTPWLPTFTDTPPSFSSVTIDAAGEKIAIILGLEKTGVLNGFEWGAVTSSIPSGSTIKYSFQNLGGGLPGGSASQYRIVSPTFGALDWKTTGILSNDGTDSGVKYEVETRGGLIALVIEWQNFVSAPDKIMMRYIKGNSAAGNNAVYQYVSSSWSRVTGSVPAVSLQYDDNTYSYLPGCFPALTIEGDVVGAEDSAEDFEWGMAFAFPAPILISGARIYSSPGGSLVLYDKDFYTVLEQVAFPDNPNVGYQDFVFTQDYLIDANDVYRIVVRGAAFVSGGTFYRFDMNSSDLQSTMEGGASFYLTSRHGADISIATWTDDLTSRPLIALRVVGIDHNNDG